MSMIYPYDYFKQNNLVVRKANSTSNRSIFLNNDSIFETYGWPIYGSVWFGFLIALIGENLAYFFYTILLGIAIDIIIFLRKYLDYKLSMANDKRVALYCKSYEEYIRGISKKYEHSELINELALRIYKYERYAVSRWVRVTSEYIQFGGGDYSGASTKIDFETENITSPQNKDIASAIALVLSEKIADMILEKTSQGEVYVEPSFSQQFPTVYIRYVPPVLPKPPVKTWD